GLPAFAQLALALGLALGAGPQLCGQALARGAIGVERGLELGADRGDRLACVGEGRAQAGDGGYEGLVALGSGADGGDAARALQASGLGALGQPALGAQGGLDASELGAGGAL